MNMDCEVCFLPFGTSGQKEPRVLECGHTFCSNCISLLNNKLCPTCRRSFRTSSTNFFLLQLISDQERSAASSALESSSNEQLHLRSISEIEREIEERNHELKERKRREAEARILNIEANITLFTEQKNGIDNNIRKLQENVIVLQETIRTQQAESNNKKKEIDRLISEKGEVLKSGGGRHPFEQQHGVLRKIMLKRNHHH